MTAAADYDTLYPGADSWWHEVEKLFVCEACNGAGTYDVALHAHPAQVDQQHRTVDCAECTAGRREFVVCDCGKEMWRTEVAMITRGTRSLAGLCEVCALGGGK
jgi:hypothetical protein